MAEGFKKPDRKARGKFSSFLYLDAQQTVSSLSALEGGLINELRNSSEEESNKTSGNGTQSANQRETREEEVLRERTGYSRISTLLDKLRDFGALGAIEQYSGQVYEAIEEGELYEFKADVRLHPFHQFVSVVQGWADAADNFGVEEDPDEPSFESLSRSVENAFYGRKNERKMLTVFADMEGAEPGYKVAMPMKKENVLVDLDEFSGKATFVAQVQRKVAEGQVIPAARLVRRTPLISPAEQQMMLAILPALQQVPGTEDIGLDAAEEDLLLRKPAVIMKPLCVYRG